MELGIERRLIRRRDTGEVLNLPAKRAGVQTLRITADEHLEGTVDEYFNEKPCVRSPCFRPHCTVRRDDGDDRNCALAGNAIGELPDATHVRVPLLLRETDGARPPRSDLVSVEDVDMMAPAREYLLDSSPERRLSGSR